MCDAPAWADLIGKPFRWGARGPDAFDCYGLVVEMSRRAGVLLPEQLVVLDPEQREKAMDAVVRSQWAPCKPTSGSVVMFRIGRHVSHCGYVLPNHRFIHCWERTGGVTVEELDVWERRVAGYYRFNAP